MSCAKKLTLKILTGQKFSLSVNFGGADSIDLKFAINLIFAINLGDNFSKNLSNFFDIFLLKFSQKFLPRSVHKDLQWYHQEVIVHSQEKKR